MPPPSEINFNATCYKNVNLSLTGSGTDRQIYVSTYARPGHYMPRYHDGRGIQKEKETGGGGNRGRAAEVSDIL